MNERCRRLEQALLEITRPFPVKQSHGDRIQEICRIADTALAQDEPAPVNDRPAPVNDGRAAPAESRPAPCPFCGDNAIEAWRVTAPATAERYWYECHLCAARGPWTRESQVEALRLWNLRELPPPK